MRISLLGAVQVSVAEDVLTGEHLTRSVQCLLGYLVLNRQRSHSREVLSATFWGDRSDDSARRCLNTTLWRLRRVLEPDGVPRGTYLVTTPTDVAFNRGSIFWLDVAELEEHAGRVTRCPLDTVDAREVAALEAAVDLYGGDLLEGFYSEWALRERERLRLLFLNSLAYVMRYHRSLGDYEGALHWGRRLLQADPLREEIHREVMRLYADNGQRALALRQFEACRAVLAAELDVEPMDETRALCAELARGRNDAAEASHVANGGGDSVETLVGLVQQVLHTLETVCDKLDDAVRALQRADESRR